jgi:hypothetical protein
MGCGQLNESMFALRLRPQQSTQRPTRGEMCPVKRPRRPRLPGLHVVAALEPETQRSYLGC